MGEEAGVCGVVGGVIMVLIGGVIVIGLGEGEVGRDGDVSGEREIGGGCDLGVKKRGTVIIREIID